MQRLPAVEPHIAPNGWFSSPRIRGIAAFRIVFDLWVRNAERQDLDEIVRDLLARLKEFATEA